MLWYIWEFVRIHVYYGRMCLMLCTFDSLLGDIIISSNNLYDSPSKFPKNVVHSFHKFVSLRNECNISLYQTHDNDDCKDVAMDL